MNGPLKPSRELCIMACIFCRDKQFLQWLSELGGGAVAFDEEMAKNFIQGACGIESRNELDKKPDAAALFHQHVRKPFIAWKEAQA